MHLLSGLIAYCHQPKKLSLDLAVLGIELPAEPELMLKMGLARPIGPLAEMLGAIA